MFVEWPYISNIYSSVNAPKVDMIRDEKYTSD